MLAAREVLGSAVHALAYGGNLSLADEGEAWL